MILQLLKSNRKAGYFIFPVIIIVICTIHLAVPGDLPFGENTPNSGLLGYYGLLKNQLVRDISALLLLLINGLLINRINREYVFTHSKSVLPAIIFILLICGIPGFQELYPVWFSITFLLIGIDSLFASFDLRKPYGNLFNAGFFLGIGSYFYTDLIVLLPAFMIGSWYLARDAHWRESALCFMGALVPWILIVTLCFLTDKTGEMTQVLASGLISVKEPVIKNIPLLIYLGFLGLFTLAGSYMILLKYDEKKISYRKYFIIFFIFFLTLVLSFFLIPAVSAEIFIIAAVPVSFLLSNYFDSIRRPFMGEIVFVVFFVLAFCVQFI